MTKSFLNHSANQAGLHLIVLLFCITSCSGKRGLSAQNLVAINQQGNKPGSPKLAFISVPVHSVDNNQNLSKYPGKAYEDREENYMVNETAINYTAPFVCGRIFFADEYSSHFIQNIKMNSLNSI